MQVAGGFGVRRPNQFQSFHKVERMGDKIHDVAAGRCRVIQQRTNSISSPRIRRVRKTLCDVPAHACAYTALCPCATCTYTYRPHRPHVQVCVYRRVCAHVYPPRVPISSVQVS